MTIPNQNVRDITLFFDCPHDSDVVYSTDTIDVGKVAVDDSAAHLGIVLRCPAAMAPPALRRF